VLEIEKCNHERTPRSQRRRLPSRCTISRLAARAGRFSFGFGLNPPPPPSLASIASWSYNSSDRATDSFSCPAPRSGLQAVFRLLIPPRSRSNPWVLPRSLASQPFQSTVLVNMNNPPGTIPGRRSHHPRRPPAHQSVSLRHSPPTSESLHKASQYRPQATTLSSPNGPASDKANPPSTISPRLANTNKQDSGESSDAGKWFENTNNNAVQSHTSLIDSMFWFWYPDSLSLIGHKMTHRSSSATRPRLELRQRDTS
jgi:hypothetical protein